jgi:hypothetical protein
VLLAAYNTFPGPPVSYTSTTTTTSYSFTTTTTTHVTTTPPTTSFSLTQITITIYTHPGLDGGRPNYPLTWNNTLSNHTSESAEIAPSAAAVTQHSVPESYDLGSIATDVVVVTVTQGAPTLTSIVTKVLQRDLSFISTSAPAVLPAATTSAEYTSSGVAMYNDSTSMWGEIFSNTTSEIDTIIPSTTPATQPDAYESYDLVSFCTDVPAATLTEGGPMPALTDIESTRNTTFGHASDTLTWLPNTTSGLEPTVTTALQPGPTEDSDLGSNSADIPFATLTGGDLTSTLNVISETIVAEMNTTTYVEYTTPTETDYVTTSNVPQATGVETTDQMNTITAAEVLSPTSISISVVSSVCSDSPDTGDTGDTLDQPGASSEIPEIPESSEIPESCGISKIGTTIPTTGPGSTGIDPSTTVPSTTSVSEDIYLTIGPASTDYAASMTTLTMVPITDDTSSASSPGDIGDATSMTTLATIPITDDTSSTTWPGEIENVTSMTTSTTTATVISAESTVTITETDLVIPMQGNRTQPFVTLISSTSSYDYDAATETTVSTVDYPSNDPVVSIQTTMPIESIQPVVSATVPSTLSAIIAPDGVHIPYGHPPLVTSHSDERNWNTSTGYIESSTQEVSGLVPTSSPFVSITTSRVFVGYPPALSGYTNGTSANIRIGSTDLSTQVDPATTTPATFIESSTEAELGTTPAATFAGAPIAPIFPLDSCSPGMWGQLGCSWTPASFFTAISWVVGPPSSLERMDVFTQAEPATTTEATLVQSSTHTEIATTPAATLPGVPPDPIVPFDSCCLPGRWGRPGCLSTPASFFDTTSSAFGRQVGNSTAVPVTSVVRGHGPEVFYTSNSSTAQSIQMATQAFTTSNSSTTQPVQTLCTTTWYSLPTDACTETKYARTESVAVNCFGCAGTHAPASSGPNETSVSRPLTFPHLLNEILAQFQMICQSFITVTEPLSTKSVCGYPETTVGSGFVTSVTSVSSTGSGASQSGNYTSAGTTTSGQ